MKPTDYDLYEGANSELLQIKPSNLPLYTYSLEGHIVLVLDCQCYKIRPYSFTNVVVLSHHPLRVTDVVSPQSCSLGNENTSVLANVKKHRLLNGMEKHLDSIYGVQITRLMYHYPTDYQETCGRGECFIFIELSPSLLYKELESLRKKYSKDSPELRAGVDRLYAEIDVARKIEYWQSQVKDWDSQIEYLGEIPENLIY